MWFLLSHTFYWMRTLRLRQPREGTCLESHRKSWAGGRNQGPSKAGAAGAGRTDFCTSLPLAPLGSPTCLDKARLVTGLRTALSTLPVASVPPHPLPIPEGGGESGREEGGSGRLVFIKAAGPALPARPRRPDPLRCPPPHVSAPTTSSTASELGARPHPPSYPRLAP